MVWILPVVYWFGDRGRRGRVHEWVQALSFLCMGWLSFLLVLTVGRDVLLLATAALPSLAAVYTLLDESGAAWVPVAALAAVGVGALAALRGPYVRRVDIPVEGLAPELDGFRIVQISDLHAGPTMRLAYVQRVVDMTKELAPDIIALTGDIVDADVKRAALLEARERLGIDSTQIIALGDGANDLKFMAEAGVSVAYHAKPVVRAQATHALNYVGLDGVLNLFN